MGNDWKTNDVCWLSDGRKAFWAGEIDGQTFVRIARAVDDPDYGYEEYPSDVLTAVGKIYNSEPLSVYGPATEKAKIDLDAIRSEERSIRDSVLALREEEKSLQSAVSKYPDIALALDFLEGRITHVVEEMAWSAPKIHLLEDFLKDTDDRGRFDGIRLVSLFGQDAYGKKTKWARNQYRDGSGSSVYFSPFRSLEEAEEHVVNLFNVALEKWRETGDRPDLAARFEGVCSKIEIPEDLKCAIAEKKAKANALKAEKLRAELAALEDTE